MIEQLRIEARGRSRSSRGATRRQARARRQGGRQARLAVSRAARDAPAAPLRRGQAHRAARPPGARRLGQGRRHPDRLRGRQPAGLRVASFKAPTDRARARLPLARARRVPARGEIGIFNRSHYEDVVAVRMLELAPEQVWKRRPGAHRRVGADARRRGHDDRQGVPQRLQGGAARAPAGADRRPREALEVPHARPRGAQALRRLHRRLRARDQRRPRPSRRRGTSSRPTTTGSRHRGRRAAARRALERIDPQLPDPRKGSRGSSSSDPAPQAGSSDAYGSSSPRRSR